jgi:hypothetical protein
VAVVVLAVLAVLVTLAADSRTKTFRYCPLEKDGPSRPSFFIKAAKPLPLRPACGTGAIQRQGGNAAAAACHFFSRFGWFAARLSSRSLAA